VVSTLRPGGKAPIVEHVNAPLALTALDARFLDVIEGRADPRFLDPREAVADLTLLERARTLADESRSPTE